MLGSRRSAWLTSGHRYAQRREHRRELDADRPAADDDDVRRHTLQRVDAISVEDVRIVERNARRVGRPRARGHQDRPAAQLALAAIG